MNEQITAFAAKNPEDCVSMIDVREGVDETDRALIALLARRFGYMDAAARIKTERCTVRDEGRKAQVVANAKSSAKSAGIPVDVMADIWDRLVEASIAYELDRWDAIRR